MIEVKQEVRVFRITLECEQCNIEMKREPVAYLTHPPLYAYKCPQCKEVKKTRETYPRTEYETVAKSV